MNVVLLCVINLMGMVSKEKVLVIGPLPPPYSGPEAAMEILMNSSFCEAFTVFHLNTNFRNSNAERGRADSAAFLSTFAFFIKLLHLILLKHPKIVYYFVTATMQGWLLRDIWVIFFSKILGAKVVIHMRGGHFKINYKTATFAVRAIIRLACSLISAGLVQSETLRNQFQGLIKDKKIISIYNAVDVEKYSNQDIFSYDPMVFFFLGHLSFAKGYCDILKVIPGIAKKYKGIKFVFAGTLIIDEKNILYNQITGEKLRLLDPIDCYKRYVENKFEENYSYLGFAGEAQKISLLKKCNAFVLPSYSEGFSMAVLEAMSMGKPVVCTPVGALKEVVRDGVHGIVIRPGDTQALKTAIMRLIADTEFRNHLASSNYGYVRESFSKEVITAQLISVFEGILNKH